MNTRFLKLAKQAGLKYSSEEALSPVEEKFAELIVQECAELFPVFCRPLSGGAVQGTIKDHFGVEE